MVPSRGRSQDPLDGHMICSLGLPRWRYCKEPTCQCRRHKGHGFDPGIGKIPWRRTWQSTPIFSPGEPHGQRSLVGYSPWSVQPHKTYSWLNTLLSQSWNLLILFEKRTSPFPLALGPTNYTASVQCRGVRGAHQVLCCLLFLGLGMELSRKAFRCPLPI